MESASLLRSVRTWFLCLLLGMGVLVVALVLAAGAEYANVEQKLKYGLSTWESDLAVAVLNSDWLGVRRVGSHLYFSEIGQLTVWAEDFPVYAFPAGFEDAASCRAGLSVPIRRYGVEIGRVDACVSVRKILTLIAGSPTVLGGALVIAAMFSLAAVVPLEHYRRSLQRVVHALKNWTEEDKHDGTLPFRQVSDATQCAIIELVDRGVRREIAMERELASTQAAQQLAMLSAQVAHDIRSPLAALNMALPDLQQCPEETRILVRSAIARVQDIANLLLSESRGSKDREPNQGGEKNARSELLAQLAESSVTEARTRWRQRLNITIESRWGAGTYGVFCAVDSGEFRTVLANLINNAVEAQPSGGSVTIVLNKNANGTACIEVCDSGPGMPEKVMKSLGHRGATFDKPDGNGLGLYHAHQACERWGGRIDVRSELGKGTKIRLCLPTVPPPLWFVSAVDIGAATAVVVLDDDASIHHIWTDRLLKARLRADSIVHLSSPDALSDWVASDDRAESALFLVDYEYIGCQENGIQLIERHSLADRSILVTSRYDEESVRQGCEALGFQLLPKSMVSYVPIFSTQAACMPCNAVLIDDDPLMRKAWEHSASRAGLALQTFSGFDQFAASAQDLSRATPIYVDFCLHDESGDAVSEKLKDMGFSSIVIATGLSRRDVGELPWVQEIIGKTPPFGQSEAASHLNNSGEQSV